MDSIKICHYSAGMQSDDGVQNWRTRYVSAHYDQALSSRIRLRTLIMRISKCEYRVYIFPDRPDIRTYDRVLKFRGWLFKSKGTAQSGKL